MNEEQDTQKEATVQEVLDLVEQAYKQDPERWARRFRRLAKDIAEGQPESASCDLAQDGLESYIAAAAAGQNVQETFPQMYSHLESCSDCRAQVDLLRVALNPPAGEPPSVATAPPRLSFLIRQSDSPWMSFPLPQMTSLRRGVRFLLNRSFLQDRLRPRSLPLRGMDLPTPLDRTWLLLSDVVHTMGADWNVEIRASSLPNPDPQWALEVAISCETGLPPNLLATLDWAGERSAQPVSADGLVRFPPASLSPLSEPGARFALTIANDS